MQFETRVDRTCSAWIRRGVLAIRPALYICILIVTVIASYTVKRGADGIFSCPANGYSSDRYLAYCQADGYGDYEHGAFWFGLEPTVRDFVTNADVLLLGNSRMQHGFSAVATDDWFEAQRTSHYLLGFTYYENAIFEGRLLRQLNPKAKVYIINLDGFFDETESQPAKAIGQEGTRLRYELKRLWQFAHGPLCHHIAALCGDQFVLYRSRSTGAWFPDGLGEFRQTPVSFGNSLNRTMASNYASAGSEFISHLPVDRSCILLTMVPAVSTDLATAQAIAEALKLQFVAPRIEGLQTFDGSHLDQKSAERWSKAFFEAAAPQIKKCTAQNADSRRGS